MGFKLSILVGVEMETGTKVSLVLQKGTNRKYAPGEVINFIKCQAYTFKDVAFKPDQEHAIKYVVDDISRLERKP